MANALTINISAADKATKVLNDINKRVTAMTRPYQNLQRSVQQFGRAAGLAAFRDKLERVSSSATRVARAFAKIAAPLTALVGGGTIAGLIALTDGWTRFGLQVSQTARILGVNAQQLYNFQNAARLVGISGQTATATFQSFADTLQDARWGRNQQAYGLLLGLGIQLKTTKAGAIDSMDALGQVADKIHAFQEAGRTGAARTLANQLGLTALLPVLMQGRVALERYEAQAQKLSGTMNFEQASAAAMRWNELRIAMDGVRNTIGAALLPTITPLVQQFGAWITANRQLIATDITNFINGLGQAFQGLTLKEVLDDVLGIVNGMLQLTAGVGKLVGALGGLKGVIVDVGAAWAGSKLLKLATWVSGAAGGTGFFGGMSAAGIAGATGIGAVGGAAVYGGAKLWEHYELGKLARDRIAVAPMAPAVMRFFQRQGWTAAQATGIAANIQAESGFDPRATGDHGQALGIGQWHPERQAAFNVWAGANRLPDLAHADLLEQLRFYDYELRHSDAGRRLAGAGTADAAGRIVSLYGERPAGGAAEAAARGALATQLAGPTVNVAVQTTVQRDGSATTRVSTPSGVKVVHTSPVNAVS